MRAFLSRARALAVLACLAAAPLAADAPTMSFRSWGAQCTPGAFQTCAAVAVSVASTPTGSVIVFRIRNLQGSSWGHDNIGPSVISQFYARDRGGQPYGVVSGGFGIVGRVDSVGVEPGRWDVTYDLGSESYWSPHLLNRGIAGCDAVPVDPAAPDVPSYATGVSGAWVTCPSQGLDGWVELRLTIDRASSADDWAFSWYAVGIPSGQGGGCDSDPAPGMVACTTVTPEPVTVSLLGVGLAGVGVVRRRRRAQAP